MLTLISLLLPALSQLPTLPSAEGPPSPASFYWLDIDQDGDQDVVALEPTGGLRLLRNTGSGIFADETRQASLAAVTAVSSVLPGDLDLDGALDLVLVGSSGLQVLRSEGGRFADVTELWGLAALGPVESAAWIDANGDARPDLHVVGASAHHVFANEAPGVFRELELGLAARATTAGASTITLGTGTSIGTAPTPELAGPLAPRTDGTRPNAGGSGASGASAPPTSKPKPIFSGGTVLGTAQPAASSAICAGSLVDQGGPGCLTASSVPTLGMLYPISNDLYVDAGTGHVGIGAASAPYRLTVSGQIVSGTGNTALGAKSAMGGGQSNAASGDHSTVAGGETNQALHQHAFIGGGLLNTSVGTRAVIGGGVGNSAGPSSVVTGGASNNANSSFAVVAGGRFNGAQATYTAVGGGANNTALGLYSVVGGGGDDTVASNGNTASGLASVVPGGRANVAAGSYSQAAGRRAQALHDGAFVWGDSTDADMVSTGPDQFVVRAAGGVGLGKVPDPAFQLDVEGIVRASDTFVSTKPAGAPFSVVSSDVNTNLNADLLDGIDAAAFSQFGFAVDNGELADDAVTSNKIAAGAVGSSELANGAVTASTLAASAVTAPGLAANAVTAPAIAFGAVGANHLATNAVSTASVLNGAITLPKLDATGGAAGQVLGHDGLAATWTAMPNTSWTPISSLPYTISAPGTYYLTGNLTGVAGADGITVAASQVLINLNGFELVGVPTSLSGITTSGVIDDARIVNGRIRSWVYGILGGVGGEGWELQGLKLRDNSSTGAAVFNCRILECDAYGNGETGFILTRGEILRCNATGNGARGYDLDMALVQECYATNNVVVSFRIKASRVVNCYAHGDGWGFDDQGKSYVSGCTSIGTGSPSLGYNGIGFSGGGSHFDSNLARGHSLGFGGSSADSFVRNRSEDNLGNYPGGVVPLSMIITFSAGVPSSTNAWANLIL